MLRLSLIAAVGISEHTNQEQSREIACQKQIVTFHGYDKVRKGKVDARERTCFLEAQNMSNLKAKPQDSLLE